jgi:3-oxoacyl-(acyl-carrier-protein) synthase
MRRRVKITGIGPVTPAGIGRDAFFKGINEPISRVRALQRTAPQEAPIVGAEVLDFDMTRYTTESNPRRMSRHTQFGLAAAILALADAGLTAEEAGRLSPVIVTGTSLMDFERINRELSLVLKRGPEAAMASNLYETSLVNVPGKISGLVGANTRMISVQTSCCSGLDAIGQAANLVASGQTELAITGGTESPLSYHPMVEFNAAELSPTNLETPEKACRPFDLWRTTGVMGEGAAMFILEPEKSLRPAHAWIAGYGYHSDPDQLTGTGIYDAVRLALNNARMGPEAVDFINAWGPGHRLIDTSEARALRRVFGAGLDNIPTVSIKGAIGTALAASGPIQVASAALSLVNGLLPPTVNWQTPDPNCRLNLSADSRRIKAEVGLVVAHGMMGSNACLVLEGACRH